MSWTNRRPKTFVGIHGLDDRETVVPRLATIGRLHKGAERTPEDIEKKRPGQDLDCFRFTSEREEITQAFHEAYGDTPRVINCYLPYPTAEENFQTACEEWLAGGLVHRCDGETMTIWKDEQGGYHTQATRPCPYATGEKTRDKKNPGCRPVGRLYAIVPELVEAGYVGPVYLVTTSLNDIQRITAALRAIEEEQMRSDPHRDGPDLTGILFTLRRVPEKISTPGGDGQRVHRTKYLVVIEPAVSWVQAQLAMAREAQMPGYHELPPGPSQEPDWEDVTTNGRTVAEVEAEVREVVEEAHEQSPGFAAEDNGGNGQEQPRVHPDVAAICGAGREAGWKNSAKALLLGMGYPNVKAILAAVEKHGLEEMCRRAREFAGGEIPWIDQEAGGPDAVPSGPEINWFDEDAASDWLRKIQSKAEQSQAHGTPSQKMVGYAVSLLHQCWPDAPAESQELLRKAFMTLVNDKPSFKEWTYGEVKALLDALVDAETKQVDQTAAGLVRALVGAAEVTAGQQPLFGEEELDG